MSTADAWDSVTRISVLNGESPHDVRGRRRYRNLVNVRRKCAEFLRHMGCSYPEIGRALGGRDHTGIMHLLGALGKQKAASNRAGSSTGL